MFRHSYDCYFFSILNMISFVNAFAHIECGSFFETSLEQFDDHAIPFYI